MFRKPAALRSIGLDRSLEIYLDDRNGGEPHVVSELRRRSNERFGPTGMNIGHTQGRFLQLLVRMTQASHVVEVGTFTGVSTLYLGWGVGERGRVVCFEKEPAPIEIARPAWQDAGVADRIAVTLGDARTKMGEYTATLDDDPVDLAFIDADKSGYATYVDLLFPHLRPGGLLVIDNTLWDGAVVDMKDTSQDTEAIRNLNQMITDRFGERAVIVPVGDGMTLIVRDHEGDIP